jgi:hypothetical protein
MGCGASTAAGEALPAADGSAVKTAGDRAEPLPGEARALSHLHTFKPPPSHPPAPAAAVHSFPDGLLAVHTRHNVPPGTASRYVFLPLLILLLACLNTLAPVYTRRNLLPGLATRFMTADS